MDKRPNIIFVHTDQQRGDCLGVEGHPVLETPTIDNLAANGVRFSHFYSACPSCIAARRSILTGQSPQTTGLVGYQGGLEFHDPTLPSVLKENGYQTYHVGRDMHQFPKRKRYGFDDMEICSGWQDGFGEYEEYFDEKAPAGSRGYWGIGVMHNDWTAVPWHLDDHLHFSNWTIDRAQRFLKRQDPSCPFFLSVGFIAPHPPLQPPEFYFNRYLRTGVPEPLMGDWVEEPEFGETSDHVSAPKVKFNDEQNLCARAGYYGLINHIDDLLRLMFNPITGIVRQLERETIVIFTSDHGEMLGDHCLWRKTLAFEGSARIPFIITAPARFGIQRNAVADCPATHADIMPTVLDMLGIDIPESVDGESLYPALKGEEMTHWRDCIHIEHAPNHQCVTDGIYKYIWRPADGKEYFFDLQKDPGELHNAVHDADISDLVGTWRDKLIQRLEHRPEGFVENGSLVPGKNYVASIPSMV